jgi:hypothetical protein
MATSPYFVVLRTPRPPNGGGKLRLKKIAISLGNSGPIFALYVGERYRIFSVC